MNRLTASKVIGGILLGSLAASLWQGICVSIGFLIHPVFRETDSLSQAVGGTFLFAAIMTIPTAIVFIVIGLPLYALGRLTHSANPLTATGLGFVLGLLNSLCWGFTPQGASIKDIFFAVAVMGWSGALAGIVFWYVIEGKCRR